MTMISQVVHFSRECFPWKDIKQSSRNKIKCTRRPNKRVNFNCCNTSSMGKSIIFWMPVAALHDLLLHCDRVWICLLHFYFYFPFYFPLYILLVGLQFRYMTNSKPPKNPHRRESHFCKWKSIPYSSINLGVKYHLNKAKLKTRNKVCKNAKQNCKTSAATVKQNLEYGEEYNIQDPGLALQLTWDVKYPTPKSKIQAN